MPAAGRAAVTEAATPVRTPSEPIAPLSRRPTMPARPQVIALEEHYLDAEVARHFTGMEAVPSRGSGGEAGIPKVAERLYDVAELRLKEMDEAGIDVQVLSHAAPSLQKFDAETAVRL